MTQSLPNVLPKLRFIDASINDGENVTVRRGIKWNLRPRAIIEGGRANGSTVELDSFVIKFSDITEKMIEYEHDKTCRDVEGLYLAMVRAYPDFSKDEIVTVVRFIYFPF